MASAHDPGPNPASRRLVITRRFDAPAEKVFDAWLDPATVGRWLFATPAGQMLRVEVDARVGGVFTIVEKRGEAIAEHFGTYLVLDRPRRLVFSFATDREQLPTHVTVDIAAFPGGCELTLSHEMDAKWAHFLDRARAGWTGILQGLGDHLAKP